MFLLNILLTLAWIALTGEFSAGNFLVGFVVVSMLLTLTRQSEASNVYVRRAQRLAAFFFFFLQELVLSSLRVMVQVLSPHLNMQPAVVAVPLTVQSDAGITLLSNLITLTPGTLTLEVAEDRSQLFVHVMNVGDVAAFRRGIQTGFERRILELTE